MRNYTYFMAAGHMSVDLTSGAMPAILPFLVTERGLTYTEVAGLVFAAAFLSSLLQPVFGFLADRVSNHWFMGFGIILSGVAFASVGFFEDYWTVFLAVSLMGVGSSMFHPEAARLVNLISGAHKGEGMAIFSVGGNAGFGVGPILAVAAVSIFGLTGTAVFGLTGLAMGLATMILVPKIVQDAGRVTFSAGGKSLRSGGSNDWAAFRKLTIVLMGRSIIFQGMLAFLPLYCISHLAVSNELGSSLLSVYAAVGIFMTILGGRLADRFELVSVLKVCTLCYVPAILLIILAPKFALVAVLVLPLAFATHGSYSPFVVLGQTYLAKNVGFAAGMTLGLSTSFGGVIAPVLGIFADGFGIEAAMYLLVLVGAVVTASAFYLPKPRKV